MTTNFVERFKQVLEMTGGNKSEFARRISASPSLITDIVMGRTKPSGKTMRLIELEFGISKHWLETGEGEMRANVVVEQQQEYGSRYIAKVAALMADMDEDTQKDICLSVEKEKLLRELLRQRDSDKKAG